MNNLIKIINLNNSGAKITKIICPNPTHDGICYAENMCKKCKSLVCQYCIVDSKEKCIMCSNVDFLEKSCSVCLTKLEYVMCYKCGKSGGSGWHKYDDCSCDVLASWDCAICDECCF